jgi:predicted TIM-barrel fold metal-dependent hydrolase
MERIKDSIKTAGITHANIMGLPGRKNANNFKNNDYIQKHCSEGDTFKGLAVLNISEVKQARAYIDQLDPFFIGIKIIAHGQGFAIDDQKLNPVYELLVDKGLFFMPHINHLIQSSVDSPFAVVSLCKRFPNLKMLLPHLGGMLFMYEKNAEAQELLKNVMYISSVSKTMYMLSVAMDICPQKVLFGSDFPFNHSHSQQQMLADVNTLGLSEENKDRLLRKNYLRTFDLAYAR